MNICDTYTMVHTGLVVGFGGTRALVGVEPRSLVLDSRAEVMVIDVEFVELLWSRSSTQYKKPGFMTHVWGLDRSNFKEGFQNTIWVSVSTRISI